MAKLFFALAALTSWLSATTTMAIAQSDFYQGKTIRIIVGFSPGGGYDAWRGCCRGTCPSIFRDSRLFW